MQGILAREAESYHLDALRDVATLHVLDYGCGTGGTTVHLAARGARAAGFDISLTRLAEARQRVAGAPGGGHAGLVQSVAEMLPFADGSFDALLGKQILHHLDLSVAIPEIARVLRPGGRAVFLEPLTPAPTAGTVSTTRSWRAIAA
jgi:ubiquinone/menaquinone biosynthesis C-methylase UbiE